MHFFWKYSSVSEGEITTRILTISIRFFLEIKLLLEKLPSTDLIFSIFQGKRIPKYSTVQVFKPDNGEISHHKFQEHLEKYVLETRMKNEITHNLKQSPRDCLKNAVLKKSDPPPLTKIHRHTNTHANTYTHTTSSIGKHTYMSLWCRLKFCNFTINQLFLVNVPGVIRNFQN